MQYFTVHCSGNQTSLHDGASLEGVQRVLQQIGFVRKQDDRNIDSPAVGGPCVNFLLPILDCVHWWLLVFGY